MADLIVFSNDVPSTPSQGQEWFNFSIGTIFKYLNNKWTPIAGGDPSEFTQPCGVFISGVLRSSLILYKSFSIKNAITNQTDTCNFILLDKGISTNRPNLGEQVDVFEYGTNEKIFGGEIIQTTQKEEADGQINFEFGISCVDFTRRFKRKFVTANYTSKTCAYIIQNIIDTYSTDFSYINVATGPTINYVAFNLMTIDQCIQKLATLSGYSWYVDYVKDIHFFLPATNYAPYILTEDVSTSGHFDNLTFTKHKNNYKNTGYLQGGFYLENYDDIIRANGTQTTFNLAYEPHAPTGGITVFVNTGAGYVAKTVLIDNFAGAADFSIGYSEKVLKNRDLATLNDGDLVKINYDRAIKVIVSRNDSTSIAAIQTLEGGDGIYECKIQDDSIETLQAARDRLTAEFRDFGGAIVSGSFVTNQTGYLSGQVLQIQLPNWGYTSSTYTIQSVTIKAVGAKNLSWTINFATIQQGFINFIKALAEKDTEWIVKGDEKSTT